MNKKIIIDIPFNVKFQPFSPTFFNNHKVSFYKSQTKEWIDYRIDIFMKYTAKSLINQTNQSFICLVRYEKDTEDLVMNAISKYDKLPNNILFTSNADDIINQCIKDYEYAYFVRLDCDDMYASTFIDQLYNMEHEKNLQCILCKKGYIYDINNDELGEIDHYSPPFYCLVYKTSDYLSNFRYKLKNDHLSAFQLNHKALTERDYIIIVHKKNTQNEYDDISSQYPVITITDKKKKDSILKDWGLL
ncbi:hypothetical protein [Tepidibacter hydrothermalis]|uniref:Rhamnosyl transferase n=1 Tax=Tepidibacter hydrothermalis TaxID=3036126 RepID=A0ABY8EHX4_9FIRM|nr:hypothetical protein [Tepidibacter hydrothermalis]WFD11384.1 hypothetical protein P4S50_04715 [Tepidibacter hydrothermalis]